MEKWENKKSRKLAKRAVTLLLAVALFFNGWVNYDFRVEAAEGNLNVNLTFANAEYSGNEFEPENLIESVTRKEDPSEQVSDYTVTVTKDGTETAILDAGTYQITVTENMAESESANSPNSGSAEFTVSQLDLSTKTLLINGKESGYENDFVYNGKEIVPEVKLEGISEALYTVDVTGAVNAGEEVKIVITAPENNSNVTGKISKSIPVSAKSIVDATVTLEKSEEVLIEDAEYLPSVTQITLADGTILSNTEMESNGFQVTVKDAENNPVISIKDPGKYKVEVTAGVNYEGTATAEYTLNYAPEKEGMVLLDGNTLSENVYDEKVTLKSGEDYEICKDQTIEYTVSSPEGGVKVLVKNKKTNEISNYQTPKFVIDKTWPKLELKLGVPEGQDNSGWTTSKTINVTADDDNLYGVYYTEADIINDALIHDSEILGGLTTPEENSLEITETIEDGKPKTYYFYAIDKAGHVTKTEMPVYKIDTEDPKIEGINTEKPYWKSSADRVVDFTLTDLSGVESDSIKVEMQGDDGSFSRLDIDLTYSDEQQTLVSAGKITVKYPGIYKVTALDQAGNTAEATFEVKQDTSAPVFNEITKDAVIGSSETYYDENSKVYWFNTKDVEVKVSVNNGEAVVGEEISSNEVWCSVSETFADPKKLDLNGASEENFPLQLGNLQNRPTTYYLKVVDKAGNESGVQSVKLGYDTTAPVIESVELPQKNKHGWIKDEKVQFRLKVQDNGSGINEESICYSFNGSTPVTPDRVTYDEKTESYVFFVKEEVDEGIIESWTITVYDHLKNAVTHQNTENNIQIDRTPPESKAYIKFFTDTKGENEGTSEAEKDDGLWYQISGWFAGQWNKLWGKETIRFEVYVKDTVSGFSETPTEALEMSYLANGDKERTKIENLKFISGLKASFEDGNQTYEGYTVYEGSITIDKDSTLKVSDFQIDRLEDCAGNILENIKLGSAEDSGVIYLDSVSPKLTDITIDSENVNKEEKERYYYNDKKSVTLTIDERFFEDTKAKPTVTLHQRIVSGEASKVASTTVTGEWTNIKGTTSYQFTVEFGEENAFAETEYWLTVSYTDGSGNQLTSDAGCVNGTFTSKIFVVDRIAPTLKYRVNPAGNCTVGDVAVYKNTENDDLEVTITIDDNETYYKDAKSNLTAKVYRKGEKEAVKVKELKIREDSDAKGDELTPNPEVQENGRIHEYSFGFDGDPLDSENEYYVTVSYADAAGNQLIKDSVEPGCEVTDGTYTSKSYIIDHVAPAFNASYNKAVRIVNGEGKDDTSSMNKPKANCKAYYSAETNGIKATYTIVEKYTNTKNEASNAPENHNDPKEELIKITKNNKDLVDTADTNYVTWEKSLEKDGKTKYTATVTIPAEEDHSTDGDYQITIQNSDCAGNLMVQEDSGNASVTGLLENGTYTSPVLVLDTTVPKVEAYYQDGNHKKVPECTKNGRDYFNRNTEDLKLVLKITDGAEKTNETEQIKGNIRLQELSEVLKNMEALDVKDKNLTKDTNAWKYIYDEVELKKATMSRESITVTIPLTSEANYNIPIGFTDLAGNKAIVTEPDGTEYKPTKEMAAYTEYVTFDKTTSEIAVKTIDGRIWKNKVLEVGEDTEVELAEDSDIRYEVINDGKFAQIINKLTFGYFAKKQIRVTITAHDAVSGVEKIYYRYENKDSQDAETIDYRILENAKIDHSDKSRMTGSVDLPISFKGVVTAYAVDVAENSAKDELSGGVGLVAEDAQMHEERSDNSVKVISDYSKTPDYYNGDVKIRFSSKDDYSGIRFIEYLAGNDKIASDHFEHSGKPIITERWIKDYTIRSESNNENNIRLALSFVDNAGHARKVPESELPKINIDTTEPKISVEYDNNDFLNEKYYKEERTATVTVEERNFDPNDVTFDLTGPTVLISDWRHIGNGGCHGGSDPSNTGHTDECKWVCEVHFREDGDYTFGFSCTDLAGNKGAYNLVDEFVIDKTMPEIEVEYNNHDVQNEFYYNAPRRATITIHEHNFDAGDVEITMTAKDDGVARAVPGVSGWSNEGDFHRATIDFDYDAEFTFDVAYEDLAGNKAEDYTEDHFVVDLTAPELEIFDIVNMSANNGEVRPGIRYHDTNYDPEGTRINMIGYQNGIQEMNGTRDLEANGLELKLDDFPYVPESDDMYTMEAVVYDLAGNSSEDSVMFSVNRFGSVYTFDEATEKLVGKDGKYYTNKEQDLVVYETNVDTLEFKEITCNLNGKLQTLKENEDYFVEVSGSDVTWKQYTYKLLKENFAEEGTYVITIYSEDRATNVSDNNTKEKKIEFVVDKTNPSILISGVEDGKQYREASREMTVDVEDNVQLSKAVVEIDGKEIVFDSAKINELDGKLVLDISSANHWQNVNVKVQDAAGNEKEIEEMRVLVTANVFVQFFMNKPLFYGVLAGTVAVSGVLWWVLIGRRKKEDEQTQ